MDAERDGRQLERRRILQYIRREAHRLHGIARQGDEQSGKLAECFFLLAQKIEKLPQARS